MKRKPYFWLLSVGAAVTATWLTILLSDLQTLHVLNSKFDSYTNDTSQADYQKNGLVIHMNDFWADVKVWRRGRELGFVSTSYIRRDISQQHKPPIYFRRLRKNNWPIPDESRGTGVIVGVRDGFLPLCFFVNDAWSASRNFFGCGGYHREKGGKYFGPETKKAYWDSHLKKYGFTKPPLLLATAKKDLVPLSRVYDSESGIESCSFYIDESYEELELELLSNPFTQCAFGVDKNAFAFGLSVSRDHIRQFNELIVGEWSQMPNPVQAIFYVSSSDESLVSPAEATLFRDYALGIRSQYFFDEGHSLPVYNLNLDAFSDEKKPLLEYSLTDSLPISLKFGFERENEGKIQSGYQ